MRRRLAACFAVGPLILAGSKHFAIPSGSTRAAVRVLASWHFSARSTLLVKRLPDFFRGGCAPHTVPCQFFWGLKGESVLPFLFALLLHHVPAPRVSV